MTGIRLISRSTVEAANPNKELADQKIELTPWDLQFLLAGYIQRGMLLHIPELKELDEESESHESVLVLVNYVKTSLTKALDHFTPLTGRLATTHHDDDDTVSFHIDCNNAGALFVHAAADDVTTADITQPSYVPSIVDSFFQLNEVQNYQGTIEPLLAVQVTLLVDGLFIGASINHTVIDGASFFCFFSSWLEMARGSSRLSKPPVFQRWFLNSTHCPIRIPQSYFKQIDDDDKNEFDIVPSSHSHSPLKVRVFNFSTKVVAKLKEKANAEVGKKGGEISSLQALVSHFWRSVVRNNKNMDPDEETSYCLLIDARQRLKDNLSQGYFGNALHIGSVTMKAKELLDNGVGNVALELNRAVASYNEEKLRDWLECWTKCPKLKRPSNLGGKNSLVTADSPRFDVYGGETGLGRPVAIRSGPANMFEGKITVRCGEEEGGIDIEVVLSLDTFQALENDQDFMATVTAKS